MMDFPAYVIIGFSPLENYWYATTTLPYDVIGCYSITADTLEEAHN